MPLSMCTAHVRADTSWILFKVELEHSNLPVRRTSTSSSVR